MEHAADHDALLEEGRRLASEREELIARGVDPALLAIPLQLDSRAAALTPDTEVEPPARMLSNKAFEVNG